MTSNVPILRVVVAAVLACAALGSTPRTASAELSVVGEGDKQELDTAQFDSDDKARYTIFKAKCTKCHPMGRPIAALRTGITPVSGDTFDENGIKKYVLKMMRKPNSGIEKEDARELVDFLRHARAIAQKGAS